MAVARRVPTLDYKLVKGKKVHQLVLELMAPTGAPLCLPLAATERV